MMTSPLLYRASRTPSSGFSVPNINFPQTGVTPQGTAKMEPVCAGPKTPEGHTDIYQDMTPTYSGKYVKAAPLEDPFMCADRTENIALNHIERTSYKPFGPPRDGFEMDGSGDQMTPCALSKDDQAAARLVSLMGFPRAASSSAPKDVSIHIMVAFGVWLAAEKHNIDANSILGDGGDFSKLVKGEFKFTEMEWLQFCEFFSKQNDKKAAWVELVRS